MSDLDFDELDKAVNSLMGDVPKVDLSKHDEVKTLTISSTLPEESRPSLAQLDSALAKVNNVAPTAATQPAPAPVAPAPAPAPPLAARRGGRFMDVVHPSSDMKGIVKPAALQSRQGLTIEPASPTTPVAPAAPRTSTAPEEEKHSDTSVAQDDTARSTEAPSTDWPDPLDMNSFDAEPETANVAEAVAVPAPSVSLPVEEDEDEAELQPLVSPFLPDAKVEKRPLGGAPVEEVPVEAATEPTEEPSTEEKEPSRTPAVSAVDETATEDASEQLPADPTTIEQPLPPELQSDLMAIETDGGTSATTVPAREAAPVVSVEKREETAPVAPAIPQTEKKPLGAVATPAVATGPTSIPQQYHEEPTTSDQTNGAIYDTDSYHQPLAHPAHTKSGWLWILWILLLLMVGGGGAVALYFLGII
jgi:hypothetical protein